LDPVRNVLTTETGANIPAQDPSGVGTCYYYPIYNGPVVLGYSSLTGTDAAHHDQAVAAQSHDVDHHNANTVWHPYTMNHTNINFVLDGGRTLHLTGGSVSSNMFTSNDISIDNFFLIGVYPQSTNLSTKNLLSYYSAWGTADSVIANNGVANSIAFNPAGINLTTNAVVRYSSTRTTPYSSVGLVTQSDYAMVPLNVKGPNGTATVPSVDLSNLVNSQVPTTIDFRGLDCGGSRFMNNIYLLFQ
jgi:hypothetical protein